MKTIPYNEKIIEKKVLLFDRIEKILNTEFIHEKLDICIDLLFEEYLKMCGLKKESTTYTTLAKTCLKIKYNMIDFYYYLNEFRYYNISTNYALYHFIRAFINKLFEDYKPTITNTINSISITINMDNLSDAFNEYKFIYNFNFPTAYDYLHLLYDLLVDINNRKMHYIYRSIVESLDLSRYHNTDDDKSIEIKIEYAKASDNIDLEHPLYTSYGYTTFDCVCNKGKFKVVFDSKSTYNKPLDFHTRCREYNTPLLLPNHVYRMTFEIGETLNILVNKYRKSFVKGDETHAEK